MIASKSAHLFLRLSLRFTVSSIVLLYQKHARRAIIKWQIFLQNFAADIRGPQLSKEIYHLQFITHHFSLKDKRVKMKNDE
jgi:hypothetical protein